MAKVAGLEKSLKDKAKKDSEALRFKFAKTDSQKKFLKDNPNVKTASEMGKLIADKKSASQSQSKMNFRGGGRVNYRGGGCAQIKGFGKARRPKKK